MGRVKFYALNMFIILYVLLHNFDDYVKKKSNMKIFEYWYNVLFLYYYYLLNAILN